MATLKVGPKLHEVDPTGAAGAWTVDRCRG